MSAAVLTCRRRPRSSSSSPAGSGGVSGLRALLAGRGRGGHHLRLAEAESNYSAAAAAASEENDRFWSEEPLVLHADACLDHLGRKVLPSVVEEGGGGRCGPKPKGWAEVSPDLTLASTVPPDDSFGRSGGSEAGGWTDFFPSPAIFAAADAADCDRKQLEQLWAEHDKALALVTKARSESEEDESSGAIESAARNLDELKRAIERLQAGRAKVETLHATSKRVKDIEIGGAHFLDWDDDLIDERRRNRPSFGQDHAIEACGCMGAWTQQGWPDEEEPATSAADGVLDFLGVARDASMAEFLGVAPAGRRREHSDPDDFAGIAATLKKGRVGTRLTLEFSRDVQGRPLTAAYSLPEIRLNDQRVGDGARLQRNDVDLVCESRHGIHQITYHGLFEIGTQHVFGLEIKRHGHTDSPALARLDIRHLTI